MSNRTAAEVGGMSGGKAAAWAVAIVAAGAVAWGSRYYFRAAETTPLPKAPAPAPVAVEPAPPKAPPIDWVAWRQKAWTRIEPRIAEAEREARAAVDEETRALVEFFEGRRTGIKPFAESVLSFKGKWAYVKSKMPKADDDAHMKYLNEQFERNVFKIDDLRRSVEQAVSIYVTRLQAIENKLLADIRDELSDALPREAPTPSFAGDQAAFHREFERLLSDVAAEVSRDTKNVVSREAASLVAGEVAAAIAVRVATAVAARLGVSAGVLGAGAASGWATFGLGLVAAVVIDYAIDQAIKASGYNPVDRVSTKVEEVLGQVRTLLVDGDPEAWSMLAQLKELEKTDRSPVVREECRKSIQAIDAGGHLGLRHELNRLHDERAGIRRAALRRLVDGVGVEG